VVAFGHTLGEGRSAARSAVASLDAADEPRVRRRAAGPIAASASLGWRRDRALSSTRSPRRLRPAPVARRGGRPNRTRPRGTLQAGAGTTPSHSRSTQAETTTTAAPRRERRLRTTPPSPTRLLVFCAQLLRLTARATRAAIAAAHYTPPTRAHAHHAPHHSAKPLAHPHRSRTARRPRATPRQAPFASRPLRHPSVRPLLHRSTPDLSLHQWLPVPGPDPVSSERLVRSELDARRSQADCDR
jgi:hypothetical protein